MGSITTVSDLGQKHKAQVAVNAGFFAKEGYGVGALKIHGRWISMPVKNRGVFGFDEQGNIFFDRLQRPAKGQPITAEFSSPPWWEPPLILWAEHLCSYEMAKFLM